jgi:hypothetical protein
MRSDPVLLEDSIHPSGGILAPAMHSQGFALGYLRRLLPEAVPKQAHAKAILDSVGQQRTFMRLP